MTVIEPKYRQPFLGLDLQALRGSVLENLSRQDPQLGLRFKTFFNDNPTLANDVERYAWVRAMRDVARIPLASEESVAEEKNRLRTALHRGTHFSASMDQLMAYVDSCIDAAFTPFLNPAWSKGQAATTRSR